MASKDIKMSKQGTSGKRTHSTLMILGTLEIIRSLKIGSFTLCDIKTGKDHLWLFMASSGSVRGVFKRQRLKKPKLLQLLLSEKVEVCN